MKYTITINQYAAVKNNMDLDLIDLAIFDFIKDFVNSANCVKINTPEGVFFWVSHKLIMESMPLLGIKSNNGIKRRVDNLISAGLLKKHPDCEKYRQTLYTFGENFDKLLFSDEASEPATEFTNPQQKLGVTRNENCGGTRNENCGYYNNNINNNIINNNIDASQKNFASHTPDNETKTKKTLFRNSEVAKMVKEGANGELDYSEFEEKFSSPEFANIDLVYYFHAVADWSDQKDMKRTKNGWLATVRNFIRGDAEKNKVKLKPQQNNNGFDMEGALKFLNNDF
jgi:hypothetical protein